MQSKWRGKSNVENERRQIGENLSHRRSSQPDPQDVYRISAQGRPVVLPGVGGITYNVRVGDLAYGWEAHHVEPGVSVENKENDMRSGQAANNAFNVLSCVGNEAIVTTGEAKGAKGVVTGKHGGIEHVLVDVQPDIMDKLVIGDARASNPAMIPSVTREQIYK